MPTVGFIRKPESRSRVRRREEADPKAQYDGVETKRARVLSISPDGQDHLALRRILAGAPLDVVGVSTRREALQCLRAMTFSIILCECDLSDGTWRDMLPYAGAASDTPYLIVTSRLADDYLWAEVLNLGGYDVIAKPFANQEVRHVLMSAWVRKSSPPAGKVLAAGSSGII